MTLRPGGGKPRRWIDATMTMEGEILAETETAREGVGEVVVEGVGNGRIEETDEVEHACRSAFEPLLSG